MRTQKRLLALKKWTYETVCKGRCMKAPADDRSMIEIVRQEPQVFLGWNPSRPDETGYLQEPINVCPGILIAPDISEVRNAEEKRFDQYNHIRRPQEFGQSLNVSILFSVYEPGVRLPGYVVEDAEGDKVLNVSKVMEGTEEGLFTLFNWMDDFNAALLGQRDIPDSDLTLDAMTMTYGPYRDSNYIVDKRPIYYGFISAKFNCYANEKPNINRDKFLL